MRPAIWSPLAAVDPLPGDPDAIAHEARRLRRLAELMQEQVGRLRQIGDPGALVGDYADALRVEALKLSNRLSQIVGRYEKTAEALESWSPLLTEYQKASLKLLCTAQDGREAQLRHEIPGYGDPARVLDVASEKARLAALDAATAEIATARANLASLVEDAETTGADIARRIRSAIHDGAKDDGWDNLKDWVDDNADTLTYIADRAGDLATIAAIAVCIVPGVNVLMWTALGLTALGAVDHLALAAAGQGSWLDVGLDAFALATFGTGKLAARGVTTSLQRASAAGEHAVRQETRRQMLHQARHTRRSAEDTMNSWTATPAEKAHANQALSRSGMAVREATTEAGRAFRTRALPSVSRWKAALVGGDSDVAREFAELESLRSRFSHNLAVTTPADRAERLYDVTTWSWRAGAAVDLGDKYATYGPDQTSDLYKQLQRRFTREVGSAW